MDDDRPPKPSTARPAPSRILVVLAVVLLILVAIAGIVLARKRAEPVAVAAPVAASMPEAAPAAPAVPPFTVVFDKAASTELPAAASEGLARFSEAARSAPGIVLASSVIDSQLDEPLARMRIANVQHGLEANGVQRGRVNVEVVVKARGKMKPDEADRVLLSVH